MQIELEELQRLKSGGEIGRNYDDSLRQIAELKQANLRANAEVKTQMEKILLLEDRVREGEGFRLELERKGAQLLQQDQRYRENIAKW